MPEKPQEYVTRAAGWVAGKYRAEGSTVTLTAAQAKYENVVLASEAGPDVQIVGSLDDPTVKASGLREKAEGEKAKRSRAKK